MLSDGGAGLGRSLAEPVYVEGWRGEGKKVIGRPDKWALLGRRLGS